MPQEHLATREPATLAWVRQPEHSVMPGLEHWAKPAPEKQALAKLPVRLARLERARRELERLERAMPVSGSRPVR